MPLPCLGRSQLPSYVNHTRGLSEEFKEWCVTNKKREGGKARPVSGAADAPRTTRSRASPPDPDLLTDALAWKFMRTIKKWDYCNNSWEVTSPEGDEVLPLEQVT